MKKRILVIIMTLVILVAGAFVLYFNLDTANKNTLTLEESKWIDTNKNQVIDIGVLNDIPVLSNEGQGLVYDYLDYVTDNNGLKFNVVAYKLDGLVEYNYKLDIVNEVGTNDVEIYKDNMVLVTKNNIQYNSLDDIKNIKIGVLVSDKEQVVNYLGTDLITYVDYNTYTDLKTAINTQPEVNPVIDAIIILKSTVTKEMIENNLNIAYHFNDLNKSYVLSVKDNNTLYNILQKTYNNFKQDNYEETYNKYLLETYYKYKNIADVEQKTLKSKNYKFGFIDYGVYNYLDYNNLRGLNGVVLKKFIDFSGLTLSYTQYNSLSKLLEDFNNKKIDFVFDLVDELKYKNQIYKTSNIYEKKLAVVLSNVNEMNISDLRSLKNSEVLTIKDSYLENYLKENNIKYKSYNNMKDLSSDFRSKDIIIVDLDNYNYYKTSMFKNSRIGYLFDLEDSYNFIFNDKEANKTFEGLFNFYISYNSIDKLIAENYELVANDTTNIIYILLIVIVLFAIYIVLDFSNHIKVMFSKLKKENKENLTKEEKIKYIDQLTSLKNRNYLNTKIETWDESEVYPQAIIVIDLNNISYINDNHGREEGDKVIAEAANILIQNQLASSEIIRTDGNEFLIYLVGYTEKQIVSYLRKLNREFKNLSYGFGVASGYSVILDAIKTIDDAVNEATIAMKENKEDIDY